MLHGFVFDRRIRIALAVLSLAALQATLAFRDLRDLRQPGNYDTAYYYTVARNLAAGRGLVDTMAWHYLGPPRKAIEAPAGDCWMVGWPVVLGTLMRGLGHSGESARRICAGLSALLPVLAFGLAWQLHPRVGTSWLAGLLLCSQTRLNQTNATTDVTLCYQLLTLLGLIAGLGALRGGRSPARLVGAGFLLALPITVRGEGFVALLAVLGTLAGWGQGGWRRRAVDAAWIVLGAGCGLMPLFGYHLAAFGQLNPAPRRLTFWLTDMDELYRLDTDPTFSAWAAQGLGVILGERLRCLRVLAYQALIQVPWPLLVAGGLGLVSGLARRSVGVIALGLFLVLTTVVPPALVPFFTNPDRFVMHVIPSLCVLAASAVADFARWAPRPSGRGPTLLVAGLVLASCTLVPARIDRWGHYGRGWKAAFASIPAHLAPGGRPADLAPGDVVLTQDPWQLNAILDVPTVMIPYDGPDAFRRIIANYHPRFVLLPVAGSKDANPRVVRFLDAYRAILAELRFAPGPASADQAWYGSTPLPPSTPSVPITGGRSGEAVSTIRGGVP